MVEFLRGLWDWGDDSGNDEELSNKNILIIFTKSEENWRAGGKFEGKFLKTNHFCHHLQ